MQSKPVLLKQSGFLVVKWMQNRYRFKSEARAEKVLIMTHEDSAHQRINFYTTLELSQKLCSCTSVGLIL